MHDDPIDERTFTDREVREILKRAVERTSSKAVAQREGLSLRDLKAVAAEVGIDPARVEEAARAVTSGGGHRGHPLVGTPLSLHYERRVHGEVGPEETPDALSIIRRATGHRGEANEIHGSLEWSGGTETVRRYVTLSARDGVTTIRSAVDLKPLVQLSYILPGFLGSVFSAIAFIGAADSGNPRGMIAALLLLPIVYAVVRTIVGVVGRKEAEKTERVVDELARLAEGDG